MPSAPLLPVSGVTTTKIGPGDKERAYVVRQNLVLKVLLGIFVLVASLAALLFTTTYEVHVQRRHSIVHALEHREEEHASHMRVLRLSTLLQVSTLAAHWAGRRACRQATMQAGERTA